MTSITPLRMSHTWAGCSKRLSLKYKGQKAPLNVIYPKNTDVTKSIGIYRSCSSWIYFNIIYYASSPALHSNTMTMIHIYRSHSWTGSQCFTCHIPVIKTFICWELPLINNLLHACPLVSNLPSLFQPILWFWLPQVQKLYSLWSKRNEAVIFNFSIMNQMLRNR